MRFTIVSSNHRDWDPLEDYRVLLRLLVESAGHEADYRDQVGIPGSCYIVVDGFQAKYAAALQDMNRRGAEFIIAATEYITNETFNDFGDGSLDCGHYGDRPYWQSPQAIPGTRTHCGRLSNLGTQKGRRSRLDELA